MGKTEVVKAPKGTRIKGRKASAERYIPFHEFLLYDPEFREMKEKAKILYAFLRKKTIYFEERTEAYELALANGEGVEGTKSYRDENDEIFCIADNAELSIILQCHYNRVPDQKKELKKYGLLEEVKQLNGPNRLYVLDPTGLSDTWTYIEEMKELRSKIKEENKAKFEKRKEAKKEKKKTSENIEPDSNSQNASYHNSQNASYHNSQNVSKTNLKGFKSTPKSLNSNLNLSISKNIENSSLPVTLQKTLTDKIDRLIDFQIKIIDIEVHYYAVKESFNEPEYNFVLRNLLDKMSEKPRNFASVMNDWLDRNRKKMNESTKKTESTPKRKEMKPDWLKEDQQEQDQEKEQESPEQKLDRVQFEAEKKKLFDRIQNYKDTKKAE